MAGFIQNERAVHCKERAFFCQGDIQAWIYGHPPGGLLVIPHGLFLFVEHPLVGHWGMNIWN